MKIKKLVILSVLLCLVLSGCGNREAEDGVLSSLADRVEEVPGQPEDSARLQPENTAWNPEDMNEEGSARESGVAQGVNASQNSASRTGTGAPPSL